MSHSPPENPLSRRYNRHTIKLSYSCMPNIGCIIARENKKKLRGTSTQDDANNCNCRNKAECPVENQCLKTNIVYCATVTCPGNGTTETYTGLSQDSMKERITKHQYDFQTPSKEKSTKLSSYIWGLKSQNLDFQVKWKILARAGAYNTSAKVCNLCNCEVFFILNILRQPV